MANLSVRGVETEVVTLLKDRAKEENVSVNTMVVRMLRQAVGREAVPQKRQRFTDLDELAGNWSKHEAAEFKNATAQFAQIEESLWK